MCTIYPFLFLVVTRRTCRTVQTQYHVAINKWHLFSRRYANICTELYISLIASVHPASCPEFICEFVVISNIQKPPVLRCWRFLWDRRWTAVNREELSTASSPVSLRWTSVMVSAHFMLSAHFTRFHFTSDLIALSRFSRFLQALRIPTPWPAACHCRARLEEDSGAMVGLTAQASSHTHQFHSSPPWHCFHMETERWDRWL